MELARSEPGGAARRPPQHLCVGEMVTRPTDTLSGREGGSASALLAGYGRPGMSRGAHNQRVQWSSPSVNQAGRAAPASAAPVCVGGMVILEPGGRAAGGAGPWGCSEP